MNHHVGLILAENLGILGTTDTTNAIFPIGVHFLQHDKHISRYYITKKKANFFSVVDYFRRTPDNGDLGCASAVLVLGCQHLPAEHNTHYLSLLPPC